MRGLHRVLLWLTLAAGVAAVTVAAALASSGAEASVARSRRSAGARGVERWTVKTLQDGPRLLHARKTTIHYLVTRPAPDSLPDTRLPFERHVFTVAAAVVLVRQEADSDLHLVLQSGGDHMIAEGPAPYCDSRATPVRHRQMLVARPYLPRTTRSLLRVLTLAWAGVPE